jgi:hypothetical protein
MKYCPNPDCPHLASTSLPAEFLEEIQVCSDYGTRLKWGEADQAIISRLEPDSIVPWVVVAAFTSGLEATVAKGRLEAEGIEAMFLDEHNANTEFLCFCGYGEIKLVVREVDGPGARELLQADYSGMVPDDEPGPAGID